MLTALPAFKGPYLTFDLWVQSSPHEVGRFAAIEAVDRLDTRLLRCGLFLSHRVRKFTPRTDVAWETFSFALLVR